jgi:hypothetical protein
MIPERLLALALAIGFASPAPAIDPGKASGTATIDGNVTSLAFAVETRKENLFDEKKRDTVVVLTDKMLGGTKPDDEVELSLRARRGELLAFALRVDRDKLVNVTVSHKGLNGLVILPGPWFQYTGARAGGTLKLAKRDYDGHSYAIDAAFAAAPYAASRPSAAPATQTPEVKSPPLPAAAAPATTSNIDRRRQATALLIQALMQRDEHRALEIIKLGVDPNGRDQSGIPVLNWAVTMCQPPVVKALIDAKADLKYERAPGDDHHDRGRGVPRSIEDAPRGGCAVIPRSGGR